MQRDHDVEAGLRREIDGLRRAMASRAVIEQAKGIVMMTYRIDATRAFALLTRWSMQHQIKVRDLAESVVRLSQSGTASPDECRADTVVRVSLLPLPATITLREA